MTTYWCDIGTIGTRTPASRAISAANMPPQLTTTSHSTSPAVGAHPRAPGPRRVPIAEHPGPGADRDAAAAGAGGQRVAQLGRVDVAVGRQVGARRPHRRWSISGNSSAASCAEISLQGQPEAPRPADLAADLLQPLRAGGQPDPAALDPAGGCVAAASCESAVQLRPSRRSSGSASGSARNCPTSPAEWKVDPLVSSARSTQQDVALAALGEVVGHAGPAHPAADDHDAGAGGERGGSRRRGVGHDATVDRRRGRHRRAPCRARAQRVRRCTGGSVGACGVACARAPRGVHRADSAPTLPGWITPCRRTRSPQPTPSRSAVAPRSTTPRSRRCSTRSRSPRSTPARSPTCPVA